MLSVPILNDGASRKKSTEKKYDTNDMGKTNKFLSPWLFVCHNRYSGLMGAYILPQTRKKCHRHKYTFPLPWIAHGNVHCRGYILPVR
jgi:hypothetical protein